MTSTGAFSNGAIQLAHGGGGRLSFDLIRSEILARFSEGPLEGLPDAARLPVPGSEIVFSTDSYVVSPWEFPGGNIGHLAVHGTVNDIAVSGGCPQWLSVSLILEEGLPMTTLRAVLNSIRDAARACGVIVATGDTKVVGRGQCDTLFVNTAGIGEAIPRFSLSPGNIREADAVIVSGTLGDHGVAVLTARESLPIQNGPQSDTAPVHRLVLALTPFAASLRVMRDPTRGGLASTLNELVNGLDRGIVLNESCLPFAPATKAVAEMLGLDLLHVASEGRMIAICAPEAAEGILEKWRKMPEGSNARQIGVVTSDAGRVILETLTGGRRLVDMPQGELLPRIC